MTEGDIMDIICLTCNKVFDREFHHRLLVKIKNLNIKYFFKK